MIRSQINELKISIVEHLGYALYSLPAGHLQVTLREIKAATRGITQLIDDERDRAERREAENATMMDDEKSEE